MLNGLGPRGRSRRVLGALLVVVVGAPVLALSAAVALPAAALAQTAPVVEVPADWALVPSGLGAGDEFRLLFRSSTELAATEGGIAVWNTRAANRAGAGHAAVRAHKDHFRIVGSTADTDARDNVFMNPNDSSHPDVAIYWLNGPRVAANTAGFWAQSWENWSGADCRTEDGAACAKATNWPWTGTNTDGTKATQHLGHNPDVRHGSLATGANTSGPISKNQRARTQSRPFYAMSPVFRVEAARDDIVDVAHDWALVPSGVGPGEGFRLLFVTTRNTEAAAAGIAFYDSFVQGEARTGHAAVREHAPRFKAVGSTASVDARDHVGMNPTDGDHLDVPVWWLGGPLAAAGSAGFWSDSWASSARTDCRDEYGRYASRCGASAGNHWTGTDTDGTKHASPLGAAQPRFGLFRANKSFSQGNVVNGAAYPMLAVSPVFRVAAPPPAVSASYTQVYEGERKTIVFEAPAVSVDFSVSHLGGLTAADYRVYSPAGSSTPVSGETWKATASNGLVKFALEGRADSDSGEAGEALRVTLSSGGKALGTADVKVRDGERPASLLFRVRRGSPTEEWVETDRPAVTLHEGGADVSYQIKLSRGAPGYAKTRVHIGPNIRNLTHVAKLRPGSNDDDRFIFRSPGPHTHGNSTSLIVGPGDGEGAWKTVTFAAGQDDDAFGHGLTLHHRASPGDLSYNIRAADEAPGFPNYEKPEVVDPWLLVNPDSRAYVQEKVGGPRAPGCPRELGNHVCWTWPIAVHIVDDDRWEQELVFARHDAGADAPDGNWVLASDDGLRKALPAVLAPGSTYTFYVRLAKDPATLPKNGSVQRNVAVTEGGVTRQVDIYPPTFLPPSIFVGASVEGRNNDKGRPDVRLEVSPDGGRQWDASGTYFITDTSGQRDHPSVEADYNYRENTPPGAKGSRLFWDEPLAVTVTVRGDTELGVSRALRVRTSWGIHSRPGARQGWSYDARLPIRIGLVEDLKPVGQRSEAGFSPRTPEEILEYVKQLNNDGEDAPFVPFADVTVEREEIMEGETARFTVTLTPAPPEPRAVRLNVARREGSTPIGVEPQLGVRTVMVGPSGSARFEIPTADNDDLGENGYLYVAVVSNPTYQVSVFGGVAETDVLSDDIEHFTDSVRVQRVTDSAATIAWDPQPGAASYEVVVLEGRGTEPRTSFTTGASIELTGLKANTDYDVAVLDDLWNRVGSVELRTLAPGGGEHRYPLLTVTAGGDITEGGTASFTVTATPAPASALTVPLAVSQRGHYAAEGERGKRSVTIPTSGSVSFEVATADDTADEPDGAIIVTLKGYEFGYMLGTSRAEVAVADNDDGSASPEVSVTAGGAVEEGASAVFTVTASPAPAEPVTVNVTVSQVGDFGAATGSRTVTIPTSGSATLSVATTDDDADEPHGSVSVDVDAGDGYTVSAAQGRATVTVADNDEPRPEISVTAVAGEVTEGGDAQFFVVAVPRPSDPLTVNVTVAQQGEFGAATGSRTVTVPAGGFTTLAIGTTDDEADEPNGSVSVTVDAGDGYTVSATQSAAKVTVADDDPPPQTPEVSVTAGSGVTEGGTASFTVTADPAPDAPLPVSVTVSQDGDFGATTGSRTVTVPTSGSATVTVSTADDEADEPDGSVSVTVEAGDGYTVAVGAGAATVSVADNDDPPPVVPEVNISGATGGEEGQDVTFTLSAAPAPPAPLAVKVTVTAGGDYGVSTGSRTVTVPTSGSATVTVSTSDDDADEPNGSVTLTLNAGDGYTVGALSADTASVLDNDDAPLAVEPEISVTAGSGVTEGGDAGFTVTASPAPTASLPVSVTVSQDGDFGATTGSRTVTVPTSGSATVTVSTSDDTDDEADGSVTVAVEAGDGYTVSATQGSASVNVSDDDPPPTDLPEVSITDAAPAVEGEPPYFLEFTVTLSEASERNVTVFYETREGTATDHLDYRGSRSARLVIYAGRQQTSLIVHVRDDVRREAHEETLYVVLTSADGAVIAHGTATGTIIDND